MKYGANTHKPIFSYSQKFKTKIRDVMNNEKNILNGASIHIGKSITSDTFLRDISIVIFVRN